MKRILLALAVAAGLSSSARADTVPMIEGLPDSYTPGQEFTFTVRVPELVGLIGYRLDLVFTTATDSQLLARAAFPTDGSYPFGTDNATRELSGIGSSAVTLTITDPADPNGPPRDPADVTPGVNDFLATITVSPNGVTGPITITVADTTVFRLQEGGDLTGFGSVSVRQEGTNGDPNGNPVPAPPALVLLAVGGLVLGARARFARRA